MSMNGMQNYKSSTEFCELAFYMTATVFYFCHPFYMAQDEHTQLSLDSQMYSPPIHSYYVFCDSYGFLAPVTVPASQVSMKPAHLHSTTVNLLPIFQRANKNYLRCNQGMVDCELPFQTWTIWNKLAIIFYEMLRFLALQ